MFQNPRVQEVDVLIGVAKWLYSNGWTLEIVSIPSGAVTNHVATKNKIIAELNAVGFSMNNVSFKHEGEDIRARQGDTLWKIECKGLSGGTSQTVKNNFDRAVASAISYYTQRERLRLGLALPEFYKYFFPNKLPQALRLAINLWVFLYVSVDEIYEFSPSEEIPT